MVGMAAKSHYAQCRRADLKMVKMVSFMFHTLPQLRDGGQTEEGAPVGPEQKVTGQHTVDKCGRTIPFL